MNDVQQRLLSLLQEIDDICQKNGIEYYIDGGTALGAIRHRGFLPWDDDADIMLTRDNYEKFRRVMRDNPIENRVLADLHNSEDYTMVYGRYCDTSTTCILRTSMMDQFESGLFIDFFILDPVPDTPEAKKEYFEILHGYCEYLNPYYYDDIVGANEWYLYFKRMGAEKGRKAVIEYVEKRLFSHPDREGTTYGFRYDRGEWFYPRDVVGHGNRVMVEGVSLPIAAKPEDYMRIHYGDNWQMIPSETDAETHNVVIDLNVPYRTFTDSYMPLINRQKAIQTYEKQHALSVRRRIATSGVDIANYRITSDLFVSVLAKQVEKKGVSMRQMLTERRYEEIRDILGNYYEMQLNRWYMYYRVFVPVTDEQLYCALYLMLVDGLYSKADKILTLRKEQGKELSRGLKQVDEIIVQLRQCVIYMEQKDYQKVAALTRKQLKDNPDVIDFAVHALCAEAEMILAAKDRKRAATFIQDMWKQNANVQNHAKVRAALAKLQVSFGSEIDHADAILILRELLEETRDGMLRLEIMDFLAEAEPEANEN